MKVYMSGPISKRSKKETDRHFGEARKALEEQGYDVVDPTTLDGTGIVEWDKFMREGIKLLMDCDSIYMLKGWEDSRGATIESDLAWELGMPIVYEGKGSLVKQKEILNEEHI